MPDLSWIGTLGRYRAFRFDKGWPTIELFRGDDTTILFAAKTSGSTVTLDDKGFNPVNVNLSTASVIFVFADPGDNGAIRFMKTTSAGQIVITDAVNGKMNITIAGSDTASLDPGAYACSVVMRDTVTNAVNTLARSTVILYRSLAEGIQW